MGIYSSSQFFGAFLGGVVGGWAYGEFGAGGVFIFCAGMVGIWWLLAVSMRAPSYLSNLMVHLDEVDKRSGEELEPLLKSLAGVAEAAVVLEERIVYLKVDHRHFDRETLDKALSA